ncbi:alpha/beta fold hydrolase [Candidatus Saccharibacteria bacterium]|nr:alpha/beta fold hydrolase [Candidatus Saccharibacteria bacterium]
MNQQITQINVTADTTNIVVFIHGFGVRYDSRGMFTDIKESLPEGWGSALFDLYTVSEDDITITTVTEQVKRVASVVAAIQSEYPNTIIHIVAHSMGCIVASLANLKIEGHVVLLAPPDTFGGRALEMYFTHYPGATKGTSELLVPRKNGTTTHIPYTFFNEMAELEPIDTIATYSSTLLIDLIQTTKDEVIGTTNFKTLGSNVHISQIAADHNFTGENRNKLIDLLAKILN